MQIDLALWGILNSSVWQEKKTVVIGKISYLPDAALTTWQSLAYLTPAASFCGRYYYFPTLLDEKTEAKWHFVTCSNTYNEYEMGPGFDSHNLIPDTRLNHHCI